MGMVLIEENDRWSVMKRIYFKPAREEMERKIDALKDIARMQKDMAKAA